MTRNGISAAIKRANRRPAETPPAEEPRVAFKTPEEWSQEFGPTPPDVRLSGHARKLFGIPSPRKGPRPALPVDLATLTPLLAPIRPSLQSVEPGGGGRHAAGEIRDDAAGKVHATERLEVVGPEPIVVDSAGRARTWGQRAIVARFEKVGVRFELSPKGGLLAVTPLGAMPPELANQVAAWEPLIRGHLADEPLTCDWCGVPAATLLFPGRVPACGVHALGDGTEPAA